MKKEASNQTRGLEVHVKMASSADVREIMGLGGGGSSGLGPNEITKEMILGTGKPKKVYAKKSDGMMKRPEGMARELYNLLCNDSSKDSPPLIPTDTSMGKDKGYKQMKAKLGMRQVRPWKWMAFTNPARRDGLVLYHWRRAADEGKEYAFARFNKKLEMPVFSDVEYANHLTADGWTRPETDHLIDLCGRFDLRFSVIHDRWDKTTFKTPRSMEDLKERYYGLCEKLETLHADPSKAGAKPFAFDADHERRRKEQLRRLYNRTPEEVKEEEMLRSELKKIEARKREREKKTQDLQKLIAQADSSSNKSSSGMADHNKKSHKKKSHGSSHKSSPTKDQLANLEAAVGGIKFPDFKSSGVSLRSQRMKLPPSVGQKKSKAIEQMLSEIGLDPNPIPSDAMCNEFNELRSDMVLLYELKNALATCDQELHSLKAQYETLCPGKTLEIPEKLRPPSTTAGVVKGDKPKNISDVIDVVGNGPTPPVRKRKAALEQSNVLKKIKNKNF